LWSTTAVAIIVVAAVAAFAVVTVVDDDNVNYINVQSFKLKFALRPTITM